MKETVISGEAVGFIRTFVFLSLIGLVSLVVFSGFVLLGIWLGYG